jgi:hypothetical protein
MSESNNVTSPDATLPVPSPGATGEELSLDSTAPARVFAHASVPQVIFSFAAMLGTCLVGRVFLSVRSFKVDPDLWWHIKVGEGILATHHWPTTDPYSFTVAGQHWLAYEWLGDVLLAGVYRTGGVRGLGALLIILGSLVALALYFFATIRCGNPKAGFLASAVLLNLATGSFNLRPQMLGYLFLILTLIVLERFRQGKRGAVWLLPVLLLVWVNTHGSWIIGLAIIGVYLASGLARIRVGALETKRWSSAERRQLAIVFLASIVATLVTPYGTGLARFPFEVATSAPLGVATIQEWLPIRFGMPGDKLFLGLVLGFLLVQALAPIKWRLEEVGLFLFGTAMACLHIRFLLIFVPCFAPLFAVILARWLPRYDRAKEIYLLNAAIMLAAIGAMAWYFPSRTAYASIVGENYPVGAVQYLDTHFVPEPMYNTYGFGGYLVWARGPEHKVFIDGRSELYEHGGVLADYVDLMNLKPGSLDVLQKDNIQSCLLWRDESLATVLGALPQWKKVFEDDTSVLFIRRQSHAPPQPEVPIARNNDGAGAGTPVQLPSASGRLSLQMNP